MVGKIGKQSIVSFISSYAGMALGMVNRIFLFPIIFSEKNEYWGLLELFVAMATVIGSFGHFGMPAVLRRFLPGLTNGRGNVLGFTLMLSIIGCFLLLLALFFGKTLVIDWFTSPNDRNLFSSYYNLLLLLVAVMVFFDYFSSIFISHSRSHLPIFLNNVIFRIGVFLVIMVGYVFSLSLERFLYMYVSLYLLNLAIALIYLWKRNMLGFGWPVFNLSNYKEYTQFGLFSILAGASGWIINYLDALFVSKYIGLQMLPVLVIAKNVISLIHVPARAVITAATPFISKAWLVNDVPAIDLVYKKTAITEIVIGGILFLGIWINIDFIVSLIPDKDDSFTLAKYVVLILGISRLIDLATGANGVIIGNSRHYRFSLYANIGLVVIVILLNVVLVPVYGIIGAAIALGSSVALSNSVMIYFLWRVERIQPFTKTHLVVLVFFISVFGLLGTPFNIGIWKDLILRNLLFLIMVGVFMFYVRPVDEINNLLKGILRIFNVSKKE